MEVDLSKVIGYSRDSLQSRALMRAIMLDLYPSKTREMNTLLDVYESGVPRKIKKEGRISSAQYAQYVQKIIDDYGLQEALVVDALNAWIDVCLGKGSAARLKHKPSIPDPVREPTFPSSGHHPHQQRQPVVPVSGDQNDYETQAVSSDSILITKFVGFDEPKTIIPNEISGKKVIGIGKNAFMGIGFNQPTTKC